ncbi:MAG: cell division inhibitor SulA [Psychromonas sp.]|jgi:cell division inhibitor SulA|uniref:SulA-like leucine-rich domain-containing protein n=1 Tax=Psychromonas sp. TaxID=1884585 RepID=UPI0039E579CB
MLFNYMQAKNRSNSTNNELTQLNNKNYLNVSYNLDNYHQLLTHMNNDHDQRWILFIAPPGKPNFTFLQQSGIHKSRILTLDANKVKDSLTLLKSTLQSNNYSTVITWLSEIDKTLQGELQGYCRANKTNCFVYCKQ